MRVFSNQHIFGYRPDSPLYVSLLRYPWSVISQATWKKYPSESTPHVLNVDYLDRTVDPDTGIVYTERLLTCTQAFPSFILRLIREDPMAYAWERSWVDGKNRLIALHSQNCTFSHIISVKEECMYSGDASSGQHSQTLFTQQVSIRAGSWIQKWGDTLVRRIEEFCQDSFQENAARGRQALDEASQRIANKPTPQT